MSAFRDKWEFDFWPDFTIEQRQVILETVEFVLQHIRSFQMGEFEAKYRTKLVEARRQWRRGDRGIINAASD
ncbi:MAG TPA: hypothetical protein VLA12_10355 [Planctomycetaceae bacterium]|nr:hypothetical protein [Planctomycetaceae bacterium]